MWAYTKAIVRILSRGFLRLSMRYYCYIFVTTRPMSGGCQSLHQQDHAFSCFPCMPHKTRPSDIFVGLMCGFACALCA